MDFVVDAHQDIAWNALDFGRDFLRSAREKRALEQGTPVPIQNGTAVCGLPDALAGGVALIFATLYVTPSWDAQFAHRSVYATSDEAYAHGQAQLAYYHRLAQSPRVRLVRARHDLDGVLASWAGTPEQRQVGLVVLMEGADPIRAPEEFPDWYAAGLRIVAPAWSQTRYSGGTTRAGRGPGGLTPLGVRLLSAMRQHNAILDVSHMAEQAFWQALDQYDGQMIASHSNPRAFCDTDRHLSDAMIRRLAGQGGVIGLVPYTLFLHHDRALASDRHHTPLTRYLDAIDYVCQLTGSARHVGIGTDWDGGFGVERIPEGFDTLADLALLSDALRARGWSPQDVQAFLSGNFLRVLRAALP